MTGKARLRPLTFYSLPVFSEDFGNSGQLTVLRLDLQKRHNKTEIKVDFYEITTTQTCD